MIKQERQEINVLQMQKEGGQLEDQRNTSHK